MNSMSLFCAATVLTMIAGCTVAPEEAMSDDVGETESAVTEETVVAGSAGFDLYKSADGLQGCERVTNLVLRSTLLPTYPVRIEHTATLSWSWQGCTGPVPAEYRQPETFGVTQTRLGCGSLLLRGQRPSGATFDIFDHRLARGGFFCGTPSVNPIITRSEGQLLYSAQRVRQTDVP